jgi:ABC-type nitrate/sulfonate/bicarbonate transport system substrate-binding protein
VLFFIAARQHGLDLGRMSLLDVTAAGTTELQALQRGELDGFVLFSPTMDRAVVDGYGYYPPNVDIGDVDFGDANSIIIANNQFLGDQDLATNFLRAYVDSIEQMRGDAEAFVALGTQVTGVDAAVAREAYRHMRFGSNIDERAIVDAARLGPEFGFANADYSGQVPELLDYGPLMRATGKSRAELSTTVR